MAHELGHLLLHDHNFNQVHVDRGFVLKLRNGISSQGIDQEEVEANRFAAELLMPKRFLEKDITMLSDIDLLDDTNISALAKPYGVSKQALLIRLSSLGFIVLRTALCVGDVLVVHERSRKTSAPPTVVWRMFVFTLILYLSLGSFMQA